MKRLFSKNNVIIFIILFSSLFLFHLPLMTKDIISADILLNNFYYDGYSWEISLGRFGLFIIGLLKSYVSISHIDLIVSYLLLSLSIILLFDLFEIKNIVFKIVIGTFFIVSPIISATLLFHYCNIAYFLAFLFSTLAVYLYYKWDNKYGRYLLPIILICISLSFYQAYLSFIITIFILYNMRLLLKKKINIKDLVHYIGLIIISIILYFISMKLSQFIFHIDMASYSNANKIGINTLLSIPSKFIDSYKLFYQFFFTDLIMKNSFFKNNILDLILIIIGIFTIGISIYKSKVKTTVKLLLIVLTLLIPVFLNSVIFVINDSKLQLLMSSSYLIIPLFIISIMDNKYIRIGSLIIFVILLRNYFIEDQATYLSLNNTFLQYKTIINSAINNNINNLDKEYILIGSIDVKKDSLSKNIYDRNYGYISDEGLFWDEYNLRSLGFKRFVSEYFGIRVNYVNEDTYKEIINNKNNKDIIYEIDNVIVIDLDNYSK